MEDFQKEFLHIKILINQKNTIFLNNEQFLTINISEDLRDKIKRFWNGLNVQDQVALFLDDNGRGSKMVTEALRSFGSAFLSAKANPKGLSSIDKAISEKTYFSTEELPGFEGRMAMTQLFCNGRNSNGAYRMHNFFYLLPADEFERESQEVGELRIGDCLQNLDSDSGSKDAMYCLKLLKEAYGEVQLKYFKMGVFLGDYLPDNLWSAWRYMNCREFTLGEATMIPITMYDTFIDNATDYFKRFIQKLQPSLLTELWKTNISIAIFSTLFENNLVLGFFMNNQKLATRYQFTPNCRQVNAKDRRKPSTQESDSIRSGSGTDSSNLKEPVAQPQKLDSKKLQNETNDGSSDNTGSNRSSNGSYHSQSSNSLSNHSLQLSKSTGGGEGISLKKQPQRSSLSKPQFETSRKQSGHQNQLNDWQAQAVPQSPHASFPSGLFAPCLRLFSSQGGPPCYFPTQGQEVRSGSPDEDELVVLIDPNQCTSYDAVHASSRVKRFFMRRNLVQFHDQQDKSFSVTGRLDRRIIEAFSQLRRDASASKGASPLAPRQTPSNPQSTDPAAQAHHSDRRPSQLSHGQKSLHEHLDSPLEPRDRQGLRGNPTATSASHRTVDAHLASTSSQQGQFNTTSVNSSKKKHFRAAGMISNEPLVGEFQAPHDDARKEGLFPHCHFTWLLKKRIVATVPPGFELLDRLPANKIDVEQPPRFSSFKP